MSADEDEYESGEEESMEEIEIEESSEDAAPMPVDEAPKNEYKVLTPDDIKTTQLKEIHEVMDLMALPSTTARQLLEAFQWDRVKLVERYFEDAAKLYKNAGIVDPNALKKVTLPTGVVECTVCCDEVEAAEVAGLNCQHWFCKDCWREYLQVQIKGEGKSSKINCPGRGCKLLVDEVFVYDVLSDEELISRYTRLIAEAFVRNNSHAKWCPNPTGCSNAVKVQLSQPVDIKCLCGFKWCYQCENPSHLPATCDMNREWQKKLSGDSETQKFLALYTKDCPNPKCRAVINKDEGCQYMTCTQCNYKFCWICCGNFDHQKHTCNAYKASEDQTDERNALNKFNFFHTRFLNHKQSLKLEGKLIENAERLMRQMEKEQNVSWMHVEYLRSAANQLSAAREILMNTYIYGYFLPETTNRELFEHLQSELEDTTNRLSLILESRSKEYEDKPKVIDLTKNVAKRLENLATGLVEGDITGGKGAKDDKVYDGPSNYSGWIWNG